MTCAQSTGRIPFPNSIFERLRLLLASVFAIGALVALVAAWFFSTAASTESYDRLLVSAAAQIAETVDVEHGQFSVAPPDSAFETLAQSVGDRFYYAVRSPGGALLTGEPSLIVEDARSASGEPTLGYRDVGGNKMRLVTIYRFIASPDGQGWSSVVVAQTLDARRRLVLGLMTKIGAAIIFVSALGFFASLEAVKRALRPFDRIGHALAERRAQDTEPLNVDSPRETQALVEAINSAFHRLDERMTRLQNFAGVAAHQIRTPLAAVGAQTELLLADRTETGRILRIEKIRTHVTKLSRLTNQLLGQAMVSYRSDRIPHQKTELVDLLRHVLRDAIPESLDRDLAVELETDAPSILVDGDNISLREALVNLVSNAVTHGASSRLHVSIRHSGEFVVIGIADDGPGIPEELWANAAQPFHLTRSDGAGAGLGLSIAADVAKAHGGRLELGQSPLGLFEIAMLLAAHPLVEDRK
jgi:two-component system, OmpR family, sensor histidine kinase TctE